MIDQVIEIIEETQDEIAINGKENYNNKEVRDMLKVIMLNIKDL